MLAAEVRGLWRLPRVQGCDPGAAWRRAAGARYPHLATARLGRAGRRPAIRRSRMPGSRVAVAVPAEPPAAADRCPGPGLRMAVESGARGRRGRAATPAASSSPRRASGCRPWQRADVQCAPRVPASSSSWKGVRDTVSSLQLCQAKEDRIGFVHSHLGLPDLLSPPLSHRRGC